MLDGGLFTDEEFNEARSYVLKQMVAPKQLRPAEAPRAILLGGQSGAGKTMLQRMCYNAFKGDVIVINGDEYRALHPRYDDLNRLYGSACVSHTAAWAARMTEECIDLLSRIGYNLVVEGTLRTVEVPLRSATLLRGRGYEVELAVMAVKPEISRLSCEIRFEQMRLAGMAPRATDPAHHDRIVQAIVANLDELEKSDVFSAVRLYTRAGDCIFPDWGKHTSASAALADVLFGSWSFQEELHYRFLQDTLARLKAAR